jgi:flagellar protein
MSPQGLNLKCKKSGGANESALRDLKFSRSGAESEQILLSERATAYFILENSRFLAFAKWSADKMQLAKIAAAVCYFLA